MFIELLLSYIYCTNILTQWVIRYVRYLQLKQIYCFDISSKGEKNSSLLANHTHYFIAFFQKVTILKILFKIINIKKKIFEKMHISGGIPSSVFL